MRRIDRVRNFKKALDANMTATRKLVRVDELSEEELIEMIDLYPEYEVGKTYAIDDIFRYDNKFYKVVQAHTSQVDWIPSELPALYLSLMPENVIPEWVQPTGSHDAYHTGDKVIFGGKVYESLIDANTWSPSDYPQGWRLVE